MQAQQAMQERYWSQQRAEKAKVLAATEQRVEQLQLLQQRSTGSGHEMVHREAVAQEPELLEVAVERLEAAAGWSQVAAEPQAAATQHSQQHIGGKQQKQ